jgi:tetratricopeptide (TPR) repeat protein
MDGRPMVCQDGTKCVFQGAPSWMSCRCRTSKGDIDCLPVKPPLGRPGRGPFAPQFGPDEGAPGFQVQSRAERLAAAENHRNNGNAGSKAGDYNRAIIEWNKAIAMDPDLGPDLTPFLAKAYGKRGTARYLAGDYERAIDDFDEALKLAPDNADIRDARVRAVQANQRGPETEKPPVMSEPKYRAPGFQVKKEIPLWDQVLQFRLFGLAWFGLAWFGAAWFGLSIIGLFVAGFAVCSENKGVSAPPRLRYDSYPEFARKFSAELDLRMTALLVFGGVLGVLSFFYYYLLIRSRWEELTGKKDDDSVYAALPADFAAQAEDPQVSPILARAREQVAGHNYEAALETLGKKSFTQLDLNYYDLFLEIHIRLGDFSRARLMLTQIIREVRNKSARKFEYQLYLSLASVCRDKGEPDLARQLREAGVEAMLKTVSAGEAPEKLYTLALSCEDEGERGLALKLYKALVDAEPSYRDAQERYKNLKAQPVVPPPAAKNISASQQSLRTAAQMIGQVLDKRYEIRGELGEGAMGVVYEGWDRRQHGKVAIKRMHSWLKSYPEEYGRFKTEAEIVGRLKHPNIVGVRGVVEQDNDIYLIFDFVDGRPASDVLRERKRFPLKECKEIFKGVCAAVHYAHKNNVVHRDLKPANIMLDASFHAMVVDFGLASELRESLTRVTHQTMSGTPAYMAPEQTLGIVKREADIYAMGVCLYEMLTGELPFNGPDTLKQKNEKVYREVSALFPWLPGGVDSLLARALEPAPSQRIDDALDFYDGLKDL